MNQLDRIEKMSSVVSLAHEKHFDSRKKFYKIVYLLQNSGENFDYVFRYQDPMGVVSGSLVDDVETAKGMKLLTERDGKEGIEVHYTGNQPIDRLSPQSKRLLRVLEREHKVALHLLATIQFLQINGYNGKRLENKIRELNPYRRDDLYLKAFELKEELKNYFLSTNSA